MESIAPLTKSEPGSPIISGNRIPHASSHSIPSVFPPAKSDSGGSASNEIPPRSSPSIPSVFLPAKSHSGGSASNEIPPRSSPSIPSVFPPTKSHSSGSASNEIPPRSSPSIYASDNFKRLRLSSSIDGEKLGSQAIVKSIAPPNTSNPSEPMRTNIKNFSLRTVRAQQDALRAQQPQREQTQFDALRAPIKRNVRNSRNRNRRNSMH